MIEPGLYVKLIFRNATQAEGIVESWSDDISILVSSDGLSKFVVLHTNEDLLGVKVCFEEPETPTQNKRNFEETVEEFKEVYARPSVDELRIHNLAHLKSMLNAQEKKIIADKVRDHSPSEVKLPQYGLPSFVPRKK